jgi:hypothetical protein
LLRCCPPSDFVIACRHVTINALVAGRFADKLSSTASTAAAAVRCRRSAAAKLPTPPRRGQAAANIRFCAAATAAANALLPPRCRSRRAVAKLPPTLRCRAAAAAAPPFVGWLLRCCPPCDFVIACHHATINALVAGRFH